MIDQKVINNLKYFSPNNDKNIDWDNVDPDSLIALDKIRSELGLSISISSNYRSPNHSEEVGGFKTDAHTEIPCTAFDIICLRSDGKWDSIKAFKILPLLITNGFNRIGFNFKNNHIHIDRSKVLPQNVLFIE